MLSLIVSVPVIFAALAVARFAAVKGAAAARGPSVQAREQISTSAGLVPRGGCLGKCTTVGSHHSSSAGRRTPRPATSSPQSVTSHRSSPSSARATDLHSHSHHHHTHASPGPAGIHPASPGSPLPSRPSMSGIRGIQDNRHFSAWRDHDGHTHFHDHNSQTSSSKSPASSGPSPPTIGPRGL